MTRRRKKITKPSIPDTVSPKTKIISVGLLISVILTLVLGGIPFGIGKYIELNSPGPFDSGAFVYSAKHVLDGAQWGVEERSSARPNTLLVNIVGVKLFGFNDTGPKIVQMVLQLTALVFMFITLRKIFGSVAGVIGTTIAAVYLSAPLIAKFGNVKEQFMIAFMIYAACAFLWYQYTHKRYWLILSGLFALQPYYFKPTGMSVVFAIILYILVVNIFSRKWKTLWAELAVFLCGYAAGMIIPGSLYAWQRILPRLFKGFPPMAIALGVGVLALAGVLVSIHTFAMKKDIAWVKKIPAWAWGVVIATVLLILAVTQWNRILAAAGLKGSGYLSDSLSARGLSELAPQIFRYYKALAVPMLAALASVTIAAVVWTGAVKKKTKPQDLQSGIVWMLAVWWILDVVFVWISPRSYEQYYLPLCASAAMLSGFIVWKWQKGLTLSTNKMPWLAGGLATAITLGCLSIPIFTNFRYSPDTGADYLETYGYKRRGFAEALNRVRQAKKGLAPWQQVGDHIHTRSSEDDMIYVWGWFPGIYVQAQRLAPVPKAFEGNMHVMPPKTLKRMVNALVRKMQEAPPKFIVDSRKRHYPNDRPPLELWPHQFAKDNPNGGKPIPNKPEFAAQYDAMYKRLLTEKIDPRQKKYNAVLATMGWATLRPWDKAMPDEAHRYDAMKPFRDFVMKNYKISGHYGIHVLLERVD